MYLMYLCDRRSHRHFQDGPAAHFRFLPSDYYIPPSLEAGPALFTRPVPPPEFVVTSGWGNDFFAKLV